MYNHDPNQQSVYLSSLSISIQTSLTQMPSLCTVDIEGRTHMFILDMCTQQ